MNFNGVLGVLAVILFLIGVNFLVILIYKAQIMGSAADLGWVIQKTTTNRWFVLGSRYSGDEPNGYD